MPLPDCNVSDWSSRIRCRHVLKIYNRDQHEVFHALDNYATKEGQNVQLLFHCATTENISKLLKDGFQTYSELGELLVGTSASAVETYSKEFLSWQVTRCVNESTLTDRTTRQPRKVQPEGFFWSLPR